MNRRNALSLSAITALALSLLPDKPIAQQAADTEGVKAASNAFYAALAVIDDGAAMEKVWAHTSYVTYVGPRSKSIIVGWDALKKMWKRQTTLRRREASRWQTLISMPTAILLGRWVLRLG